MSITKGLILVFCNHASIGETFRAQQNFATPLGGRQIAPNFYDTYNPQAGITFFLIKLAKKTADLRHGSVSFAEVSATTCQ